MKIHVAAEQNRLPISIVIDSANEYDFTRLIDVVENISDHLDDDTIEQIISVYVDKDFDSKTIREYLKSRNIADCIPYRNFKTRTNQTNNQEDYNQVVVERFFAWLKNEFHRTRIRYERITENYLTFVNIASIMMYWRVLG